MSKISGTSGQPPRFPNRRENSNNAGLPLDAGDAVIQATDATSPAAPPNDPAERRSRDSFKQQVREGERIKSELHMGPRGMKEPGETAAQYGVTANQVQTGVQERNRRLNHAECVRDERLAEVRLKNKNAEVTKLERQVKADELSVKMSQDKLDKTTARIEELRKQNNNAGAEDQKLIQQKIKMAQEQQATEQNALAKHKKKLADDRTLLATTKQEREQLQKEYEAARERHNRSH